jgi:hypothetical protein
MPELLVHNGSSYTLSIVDAPILERGSVDLLRANADAAIRHIAEHIRWNGILDFVIRFDANRLLGDYWQPNGAGFAGYIQGWGNADRTPAQEEAITGIDANGGEYDAGMWVNPDNIRIKDYGQEMYLDPNPDLSKSIDWVRQRDLVELFLHETVHALGIASRAQYGGPPSSFDRLTADIDGNWYFIGKNGVNAYGGPVPLSGDADDGDRYRGHFGEHLPVGDHLMENFGLPGRSLLSNLELGVLADLGYNIVKWVEPDSTAPESSNASTDPITGTGPQTYQLETKNTYMISKFDPATDQLEIPDDLIDKLPNKSFYSIDYPNHPGTDATRKEIKKFKKSKNAAKKLERKSDRIGDAFIHVQRTGEFYVDTNGSSRGFGEGGLLAVLTMDDQPSIGIGNILL